MKFKYADEQNVLIIVELLKKHGIKKIVTSPGTTNICLNVSLQHDGSFEMYSCIDERSAAYMACGLAAESGETVVITCTEATASRDYLPGLTEAYHRKLPILAITGMHGVSVVGHLTPQSIDRTVSPNDSLRLKVTLPILKDEDDVWESVIKINQAILETKRYGGGPAQINFPTSKTFYNFNIDNLPDTRMINRYCVGDEFPDLPSGKIVVFVGSHKPWSREQEKMVDFFCAQHDAVVFCDNSGKYYGKFAIHPYALASQPYSYDIFEDISLVIHIGEEAFDEPTMKKLKASKETWRVSEDGEIRDTFRNLSNVFQMREIDFFGNYVFDDTGIFLDSYYNNCRSLYNNLFQNMPELPLSNVYVASKIVPELPNNSIIHFGASNTIRAWSFFELPESVCADSNMGCRGIDGAVSASVGNSLAHPDNLCFCVLGDLTFYYDMSILGNRHIKGNYRILVVNNCGGNIFKQPGALGHQIGDENADMFVAAGGHYGGKDSEFIKHYAEGIGFEYLVASTKDEFKAVYKRFISAETSNPILFEVKTDDDSEAEGFYKMKTIMMDTKSRFKQQAKKILGDEGSVLVRGLINK